MGRGKMPKIVEETQDERDREAKADTEYNDIVNRDIDASTLVTVKRYEGANKLKWPISKAKKINRIAIHHTSEALKQDADDMTLMRAIYLYHTKTRGWHDIGYNFVIGQRGTIYE
jgi:hypothetical protein